MLSSQKQRGFTIVELLIVIVVIGILAAITIVAYNGIQTRARNAQRLSDMSTITKALEIYKIQTGSYPMPSYNGTGGWEVSSISPANFLSALKTSKVLAKVPVDPLNVGNANEAGSSNYIYYLYGAGEHGCDVAKGPFYILMSISNDGPRIASAPGFSCPGAGWNWGYWSTGSFTN